MTSKLRRVDHTPGSLQRWARSRPVLYRLTLGTRLLLAVGFIPTGTVKLLGRRFTSMSPESDIGLFFETLYRVRMSAQPDRRAHVRTLPPELARTGSVRAARAA